MSLEANRRIRKRRIDTEPIDNYADRDEYAERYFQMPRNSKVTINHSPTNKLKLMPIKASMMKGQNDQKIKNNWSVRRAKSHLGHEVQQLKGDISKIRHQIMTKRSKKSKQNYVTHQNENMDDQALYSPIKPAKRQLFKPFWNEANKRSAKKYNQVPVSNSQFIHIQNNQSVASESQEEEQQQHQSGLYFPIIEKGRKETQVKSRVKERTSPSQLQQYSPQRLRQYFQMFRNQRNEKARWNMKNFRKVAHAVLFTIYLRKFNERMRQRREKNFTKFVTTQLKTRLLQIKQIIIQHSKPFFDAVSQQYNFDFRPNQRDDSKLRKEKLKYIKKLITLQIQCLKQAVTSIMVNSERFSQLLYYLCRHGSYSCFHSIFTSEEINLLCISQFHGYLRAQKYLEQSALVSLVLIKLLLFNVLMDQTLIAEIFGNKNAGFIYKNILLVGNILYQLFIDIQDDQLERAPPLYKVGNWQELKHRMNFNLAQNMTVKEGLFLKNQLISGLQDHKTIIELFGTKQMVPEKQQIQQIIKQLHNLICNHHDKVRQKSFVK